MKEKIAFLERLGFSIVTLDQRHIRVQRHGYIVTGTIRQVYDDIRHGGYKQ